MRRVFVGVVLVVLASATGQTAEPLPPSELFPLPIPLPFLESRSCDDVVVHYPQYDNSKNVTLENHDDSLSPAASTTKSNFNYRASKMSVISPPGLGGLAMFDSFHVNKNAGATAVDAYTARMLVAPYTSPTVSLAYFSVGSDYKKSGASATNDLQSYVHVGSYSLSVSTVFEAVFEFVDVNANGVFDEKIDPVLSRYPLAKESWDRVCATSDNSASPLRVVNITTNSKANFFFSVQGQFASQIGLNTDGVVLTPTSVKIDVEVRDYPYVRNNTYLALSILVATAKAKSDFAANVTSHGGNIEIKSDDASLYVDWEGDADVDGTMKKMNPSAMVAAAASSLPGLSQMMFFADALSPINVHRVVFTPAKPQAQRVYWDPRIGLGSRPVVASGSSLSTGVIVVISIISVILAGSIGYFSYQKCCAPRADYQSLP